jgi:hypothetical protein
MFKRFSSAVVAALLLCTTPVQAADYRLDFTVTNFSPVFLIPPYENDTPFNLATGYAIFSADSLYSTWTALSEFSLTVGDAHYTLSAVDMQFKAGGVYIGAVLSGWTAMYAGTNDFWMELDATNTSTFRYTSVLKESYWRGDDVKISVVPVPEPETYAMLIAGLGLMGVVARRRRKA